MTPLARIDGESLKANIALNDYAPLGAGRSLRLLAEKYRQAKGEKPPTIHLSTLEQWSAAFMWQARIAEYEKQNQIALLQKRQQRQLEWEEKAWTMATHLFNIAQQMSNFPLVQTKTKDGKTIIIPMHWTADTIPRMVQTADKLARLATHTETDIQQINLNLDEILPEGVSPEQFDLLIDGLAAQLLQQINPD